MRYLLALALAVAVPLAAQSDPTARVDFDTEVRPILADNCFACHGPDAKHRRAGLRLDRRAEATSSLKSGNVAIVAGDVAASALVGRVRSQDPDHVMPPPETGHKLSVAQQDTLVRWIEQGAPWSEHYAFQRIRKPPVPRVAGASAKGAPPAAIDAFIRSRLRANGLEPSPPADRYALLRRVTLDLTGLPPTPEAIRAFVEDSRSDAYERVVDRLLESDAHAEHMARYWLDAARYADTHGLHLDNYREMWPYRDWVIQAFRDNLGYDEFVRRQLAGDLLPAPTLADQVASGFNRCHVTTAEGGSIKEEVRVRNVVDRVSTFGTVFMGLTVGCAVCHDHKFDPIPQRDFYSLSAFFNSLAADPMDGNRKDHAPVVRVPSAEQRRELAALDQRVGALEKQIDAAVEATVYDPSLAPAADDSTVSVSSGPPREVRWVDGELPPGAEVVGPDFRFVGRGADRALAAGPGQLAFVRSSRPLAIADGDTELVAWLRVDPRQLPAAVMIQWNSTGDANGWNHGVYLGDESIPYGVAGTPARVRFGDLPTTDRWLRIAVPARRVGLSAGSTVHGLALSQSGGSVQWQRIGLVTGAAGVGPSDYYWVDDELPAGAQAQGDGKTWQFVGVGKGGPEPIAGSKTWRRRGRGLNQDYFNGARDPLVLQPQDRLIAHVWLDPKDPPTSIQLQFHSGNWNHRSRWGAAAHGAGQRGGGDFRASEKVPATGRWVRLEVRPSDVGLRAGMAVDGFAFTQVGGTVHWDAAGVHTWSPPDGSHRWLLDAWVERAAVDATLPKAVRAAAELDAEKRSVQQQKVLRDWFVKHVWAHNRAQMEPLLTKLESAKEQRGKVAAKVPTTLVMVERARARPTYVLRRGQYTARGEAVRRSTPAFLPPMRQNLPRNRLGLAEWLLDAEHPLTARVQINRLWQQVFGVGLVKTAEDFGNQGARPTHPMLLDWLAATFVQEGWDMRRMMRRMVLSATYRQSSLVTQKHLELDPENRWLARAPRHRLDAEILRDSALMLGGMLVDRVGGPSVKPPQPGGLWRAVGYSSSNTAKFVADKGPEKVWRRSLYTFWKRTAPAPQMTTFDAPSRESCSVRRERTNTPLQALLLMNDPQYVEAARGLAQRIVALDRGGGPSADERRAAEALLWVTGRPARPDDVANVTAFVREQRDRFAQDPAAVKQLLAVGALAVPAALDRVEVGTWTVGANLLLNLDEFVTKP